MKKSVIAVLSVVLCLMLSVTAFAAATAEIKNVNRTDDDITLDITVSELPEGLKDLAAVTVKYTYDTDKMSFSSASSELLTGSFVSSDTGIAWFAQSGEELGADALTEKEGLLATVKLSRKSDQYGDVDFKVTMLHFCDSDLKTADILPQDVTIDLGTKPSTSRPSSSGGGGSTTYTVKFDTDGGSEIASVKVNKNDTVSEPADPTKEGYTFAGWYADKELKTEYDFSSKVTKAVTLYAAWTKVEEKPSVPVDDDEKPAKKNFDDVNENDWFAKNVEFVVENGLMGGVSDTEFAPDSLLNRAMLVTILYRLEGEPAVNRSIPFADVKADAYYASAVIWAQQNGIVSGISENEFAPENNITREQIATIIHRYAKYKGYDVSVGEDTNILSYTDAETVSEYAVEAVQYAVGSGLMNGKTASTLNPADYATRAEIAAILQRFVEANK